MPMKAGKRNQTVGQRTLKNIYYEVFNNLILKV